jgi:hypothetical protein
MMPPHKMQVGDITAAETWSVLWIALQAWILPRFGVST